MKTLMNRKEAEREGKLTMLIAADIEVGFDKVQTSKIKTGDIDVDPKYRKWIYNWTQNRRMVFRFNGKLDDQEYVVNSGIPQKSPLSPYLFGAYIKQIMYSNRERKA